MSQDRLGSRRRVLLLLSAVVLLALLLSSDAIYQALGRVLSAAAEWITPHPGWGALIFVLLSAASAMLAFFSTAILTPIGIVTWGVVGTGVLLWVGWLLGGVTAYLLGRYLGRPLVERLVPASPLAAYGDRFSARARFPLVLLFQLALPSEIPGYVLGLARVHFLVYLPALALAELPYAVGTVLLSASIVERRIVVLVGLALVGLVLGLVVVGALHRRLAR